MQLPHNVLADVQQTPRGSVVVLGDQLLTDELSTEHALALAININAHLLDANHRRIISYADARF